MTDEEKKREKDSWKQMTFREKLVHFRSYYLIQTLAVAAAAVLVIELIWNYTRPREVNVLTVAIFDQYLDMGKLTAFEQQVEEKLGCRDLETVSIEDGYSSEDHNSMTKFMVLSATQTLDVVIAPEEQFRSMAGAGYFLDLHDILPADELKEWGELLVSAPGFDEEYTDNDEMNNGNGMGEEAEYGFSLEASVVWAGIASIEEPMIAAVVSGSKYYDHAAFFLEMMAES